MCAKHLVGLVSGSCAIFYESSLRMPSLSAVWTPKPLQNASKMLPNGWGRGPGALKSAPEDPRAKACPKTFGSAPEALWTRLGHPSSVLEDIRRSSFEIQIEIEA